MRLCLSVHSTLIYFQSFILSLLLTLYLYLLLALYWFHPVWPDWAIYWTLGKFLMPLAKNNLPKSTTFLGNFVKVSKSIIFLVKSNHFWATFIDIWWFFLVALVSSLSLSRYLSSFLSLVFFLCVGFTSFLRSSITFQLFIFASVCPLLPLAIFIIFYVFITSLLSNTLVLCT